MQEPAIRGFFCAQYQYKDPTTTGADLRIANNAQFIQREVATPLAARR